METTKEEFIKKCYDDLGLRILNEEGEFIEERIPIEDCRPARCGEIQLIYKIMHQLQIYISILNDQKLKGSEIDLQNIYKREIVSFAYELLSNEIIRSKYLITWQKLYKFESAEDNNALLESVTEDWEVLQTKIFERYPDLEKTKIKREEQVFLRDVLDLESSNFDHTTIREKIWELFYPLERNCLQLLILQLLSDNVDIPVMENVIISLSQWIYVHDYLARLNEIRNFIVNTFSKEDITHEDYINIRDFILKNVPGKYFDIPEKDSKKDKEIISKGNSSIVSWSLTIAKIRFGHSQLPWLEMIGFLGYIIEKSHLIARKKFFDKFSQHLETYITLQQTSSGWQEILKGTQSFRFKGLYRKNAKKYLLEKSKLKVQEQLSLLKSTNHPHNKSKQRLALAILVSLGELAKLVKKFKGEKFLREFLILRDISVLHFENGQLLEDLYRFHLLQNKFKLQEWEKIYEYLGDLDLDHLLKLSTTVGNKLDEIDWNPRGIDTQSLQGTDLLQILSLTDQQKCNNFDWTILGSVFQEKSRLTRITQIFQGPSLLSVESGDVDHLLKQDPLLREIYSDDIRNSVVAAIEWTEDLNNEITRTVPKPISQKVTKKLKERVFCSKREPLNCVDILKDFILQDGLLDLIQKHVDEFFNIVDYSLVLEDKDLDSILVTLKSPGFAPDAIKVIEQNFSKDLNYKKIMEIIDWRIQFDTVIKKHTSSKIQINLIQQFYLEKLFARSTNNLEIFLLNLETDVLDANHIKNINSAIKKWGTDVDPEGKLKNSKYKNLLNLIKQFQTNWQTSTEKLLSNPSFQKKIGNDWEGINCLAQKAIQWRTQLTLLIEGFDEYNETKKYEIMKIILQIVFAKEKPTPKNLDCKIIAKEISLDNITLQGLQTKLDTFLKNVDPGNILQNPELAHVLDTLASNNKKEKVLQALQEYKNSLSGQLVSPARNLGKKMRLVQFWCKYLASLMDNIKQILVEGGLLEHFNHQQIFEMLTKQQDTRFALEYSVNVLRAVLDKMKEHMPAILVEADKPPFAEHTQRIINIYHHLIADLETRMQNANAYFHNHDLRSSNYIKEVELRKFCINAIHSLMNKFESSIPNILADFVPNSALEQMKDILESPDTKLKPELDKIEGITLTNSQIALIKQTLFHLVLFNQDSVDSVLLGDEIPEEIKPIFRGLISALKTGKDLKYQSTEQLLDSLNSIFSDNPLLMHLVNAVRPVIVHAGNKISQKIEGIYSNLYGAVLPIITLTGHQNEVDTKVSHLMELALLISSLFTDPLESSLMPLSPKFSRPYLTAYFHHLIGVINFTTQKNSAPDLEVFAKNVTQQVAESQSFSAIQDVLNNIVYQDKRIHPDILDFIEKRDKLLSQQHLLWDATTLMFQNIKKELPQTLLFTKIFEEYLLQQRDVNIAYDRLKVNSSTIIESISEHIDWTQWLISSIDRLIAYAEFTGHNTRFYRRETELLSSEFYIHPSYTLICEYFGSSQLNEQVKNYLIEHDGTLRYLPDFGLNYFKPGSATGLHWGEVPFDNTIGELQEYYIDGRTLECGFFGLGITRKRAGELLLQDEHRENSQIVDVMIDEFLLEFGEDTANFSAQLIQRLEDQNLIWDRSIDIREWLKEKDVYQAVIRYLFFDNAHTAFIPEHINGMLEAFSIILNTRIVVWCVNDTHPGILLDTHRYIKNPFNPIHLHFIDGMVGGHFNLLTFTEKDTRGGKS